MMMVVGIGQGMMMVVMMVVMGTGQGMMMMVVGRE